MNDEIKDIVRQLRQPHRVPNPLALFKICEKAADIIESLSEKPEVKRGRKPTEETAPKDHQ